MRGIDPIGDSENLLVFKFVAVLLFNLYTQERYNGSTLSTPRGEERLR